MGYRSGTVALIGKPNVGKSTLTNLLVGHKVSIVSNKPQTTRTNVRGILTTPEFQVVLVDTPGVHEPHTHLGKIMIQSARAAFADVDLVLAVVDASADPSDEDRAVAKMLQQSWRYPWKDENPDFSGIVLCLNKMDRLKPEFVVERVQAYQALFGTETSMLTCLTKRQNADKLLSLIVERLPEGEALFPEDMFTDAPMRRLSAELIREKALAATRQEVPHAIGCVIEDWKEEGGRTSIFASIFCEKDGQKAILIGKGGSMLKKIGQESRLEIEELIGGPVFLELHVKVRADWRQSPRMLRELEYL